MSANQPAGSGQERRLQRVLHYVEDYWMPVNPGLLRKLQQEITAFDPQEQASTLIDDLMGDVSLFCHCVRNIAARGGENGGLKNPVAALKALTVHELSEILPAEGMLVSPHTLQTGSEVQIARFREVLLSAAACEVLGERCDLDEGQGYAAMILRQLGLTLIAWNYPMVYQEAIAELASGGTLDQLLAQRLGFSPQLLAVRLLEKWGVGFEGLQYLGMHTDEEMDLLAGAGATVADLCRVAEALARSNEPGLYPSARADWDFARGEFERLVGPDGLAEVMDHFYELCEAYVTFVPEVFQVGVLFPHSGREEAVPAEAPYLPDNPFLSRCSERCAEALLQFERQMARETDRRLALQRLLDDVAPAFDFPGFLVYTIDPGLMALVVQVARGEVTLRSHDPVEYVMGLSTNDAVSVALRSIEPVVQFQKEPGGDMRSAIAGVLGEMHRVGVLYVEVNQILIGDPHEPALIHFMAFRWALQRCLGLQ